MRASLAPSEDPGKVLAAVEFVLGEVDRVVEKGARQVKVESTAGGALDVFHDQLRDRKVRGAARKRLLTGRSGRVTTVMLNRQAAAAGVVALCDSEGESPLGPLYLTVESDALDEIIQWLTDYPGG